MSYKKDLLLIVGFFVLLFIAWVATGGPQHAKQTGDAYNKFQEPLDPWNGAKTYDEPLFN